MLCAEVRLKCSKIVGLLLNSALCTTGVKMKKPTFNLDGAGEMLPEDFVLAIGGVGERRNIERMKKAVKGYNLIISGVTIPWLTEEELPLLYNSAKVLLYPSLYEGFGLPILEAMKCGLPVITSKNSSMPEVAGDAAEYANPLDIEDIRIKLEGVMNNEKQRNQMIERWFKQANKFSWDKTANETAALYKDLYKRN